MKAAVPYGFVQLRASFTDGIRKLIDHGKKCKKQGISYKKYTAFVVCFREVKFTFSVLS
jgi:hypothetical protein